MYGGTLPLVFNIMGVMRNAFAPTLIGGRYALGKGASVRCAARWALGATWVQGRGPNAQQAQPLGLLLPWKQVLQAIKSPALRGACLVLNGQ